MIKIIIIFILTLNVIGCNVTSKNLKYELDSFELHPSDNAIRNVSKGDTFTIESSSKVLVFQIIN